MNKSALKTFATNARRELLKKVEARAMKIGITEDNIKKADIESSDAIFIDGKQLSKEEKIQRDRLIDRIDQIGFKRVMEEVAYTWFNRFTALRFMEVNEYLPTKVRVLSSTNVDSTEPDMMKEALSLDLDLDKEYIYELKINNNSEELFKYLIIKHCNDLNRYMPFMFETIDDYREILFPEGLLATDSFVRQMTNTVVIPEDNWKKVEVIGWLYQYYISDEKDRVIKAKKKYKTEEIPFATQLFTPDWIVRYMVQNSLGRYWMESHSEHRELIRSWEFYLENPQSKCDLEGNLTPYINKELKVEDIKCFDPAMGSGHILVYMFDVLFEIYSKCGYMEREIPRLIIENNIYGLDIDDRAYQLACFSLIMKALERNSRFLRNIEKEGLSLNLASIQETNNLSKEDIVYISGADEGNSFDIFSYLVNKFKDAKLYGSLIQIDNHNFYLDWLNAKYSELKKKSVDNLFEYDLIAKALNIIPSIIKQINILSIQYNVLVSNPPYVSSLYMSPELREFVRKEYPIAKEDIYACFIYRTTQWLGKDGSAGFLSPYSWMFQSSYEELRKYILSRTTISSLVQLEYNSFEVATVQVASFTFRNYDVNSSGEYIDLSKFPGVDLQSIKTLEAVRNPEVNYRYTTYKEKYKDLNGSSIAYWLTDDFIQLIKNSDTLNNSFGEAKQGLASADNNRFLRLWFEVDINNVGFNYKDRTEATISKKKWFPHNKGGKFRKWYGNNYWIINWENDGEELKDFSKSVIRNSQYYFKEGITWSDLTAGGFSARYSEQGKIFDSSGPTLFPFAHSDIYYGIGYMNSNLFQQLLDINCGGMHYSNGVVGGLPYIECEDYEIKDTISTLSRDCVEIVKSDWDDAEVSWNFKKHPYLNYLNLSDLKISTIDQLYREEQQDRVQQLVKKEKQLNSLFKNLASLEASHLDSEDKYLSIEMNSTKENIISLLQYIVGCILGRYSVSKEGIVYAGGDFDQSVYKGFLPNDDNILPLLENEYFDNGIVTRTVEFLELLFGKENLTENLNFIAQALEKKMGETSKETLRRYFFNQFFEDHTKIYSTRGRKAPVYWLFTSGKEKAFNCLIYMHRYDKTTLSRIRTDYLHEYQIRFDAEKKELLNIIDGDSTAKEISNAKKELKSLDKKIDELKAYDELLHHMADMQIEIDLDDGVKVNYEKFKGLVAKI
ncbi:BREX-1 system adenine-specific DNA-methyltransferase PglX [Priestia flexa]|uniref:BREX-1 system adenine-specific DNA-methyltransferase PglX n=1 Tax=Priestia flexa TaxID=86664 RepID=UPI001C98A270|nr:BREX-1 system adenine-specific DNA-methyltransferase PglX [Priestia flexa]MBY6088216.1 BREX-1 system adenine-specific DNA-methyltransferase PglX [Priestia flexa]